ncbi:MAG TPA: 30S ribosomal protein S2 [Planctomycetota bacterium]|nr:MAG: 30S ribosomal protein S2 [Planctomycetes bacterium ADurb.Bin069]HNR99722.1 30S ribosomal protein S2 [Planctomycetota bacterium]HNU25341.1 30S ribosomal protein S2 [Planctomycetota bacterium]HOE29390.1 30S ribosomal protein S2 [Planctomycetota bacterium]HOE87502.1 30S ribosomal protein S2 [Planctomycetota bacterium]
MTDINIQDLVASGVHFGHRVSRWNPKMKPYIYGTKNLIHIVDLRLTVRGLLRACGFLRKLAAAGRDVVFVSTKRQAQSIIKGAAESCGMHWVTERWLGGTLTNHATIRTRLKRLEFLENLETSGEIDGYSKKMISSFRRERRKILRNLEGIRNMRTLPGALVVVDVKREAIAVREANKLGVVVIGLVDTDCDPDGVDIVIPGNDDAFRAIEVVLKPLADAIVAGRDKAISSPADFPVQQAEDAAEPAAAAGLERE